MSISVSIASSLARLIPATRANRLLILIYHRVREHADPMFPGEVTAEQFDWQMRLLRECCHPLPLSQAIVGMQAGTLPPRAVAITFDDGYQDNSEVALPILLRNGVSATFFIATSFLDGGVMWNDAVIESLRGSRNTEVDFSDFGIGAVTLGDEANRGPIAERLIKTIKHLAPAVRAGRVRQIVERCGVALPGNLMMTSDQIRKLQAAGMEIGAHTVSHPILQTLEADAARLEISGSRERLRQILGGEVHAFAYPNGRPGHDYGPRERDLVASLGFEYAASTTWGAATVASDRFQLPRFTPWDRHPARWLARLLMAYRQTA